MNERFDAFNGTFVRLSPEDTDDLEAAGLETRQQQVDFGRALADVVAHAERMHATQVAAEKAMQAAIEAGCDRDHVATAPSFSRAR